mmetsp:Transcript_41106/g.119049  ORF Transcript_41106/g.119049 Transcript_41106/m.119049 type:complete len:407 (+) Transcript_41106:111-1331(+)
MKLSLAAALLGQTLPALSKRHGPILTRDGKLSLDSEILKATTPLSSILEHDDERRGLRRHRRLKRQMARNLKNSPSALKTMMVPCDPTSTDADVGILSCGDDHVCEPSDTSSLGGICTPVQLKEDEGVGRDFMLRGKVPLVDHHESFAAKGEAMVQCDPASVDIGILACEDGQYCEQDETSELGGFCVDSLTQDNRRLANALDYYLSQCGAYPPDAPYMFCDCSQVKKNKGGTMTCNQNTTSLTVQGCYGVAVSNVFTYTFEKKDLVSSTDCYSTTTPFQETICFTYPEEAGGCTAYWNGQLCTSCVLTNYYVASFNCTNVAGGRIGDSVKDMLTALDQCANSTCTNFCGEGFTIPPANFPNTAYGYFNLCGEFAYIMSNKLAPDVVCPIYMAAAQNGRCCAPVPA